MNSLVQHELPGITDLRNELMDMISDQDLACKLPECNLTLGELCEEMGHIQQVYTHFFRTSMQDWECCASKPEVPNSVASLTTWYKKLDAELEEALSGLSEDDLYNKQLGRRHGFTPSPYVQFRVYHEALLIFYQEAAVYLQALEKQLTDPWKSWIGWREIDGGRA